MPYHLKTTKMTTDRRDIILEFHRAIIDIYKEHELKNLAGVNNDFMLNGRQIVQWHSDIVRKGMCKYSEVFNFFQNFDDLRFCCDESMYFLANMYLYRPYMNNPAQDGYALGENTIYPNEQNLEAKRYSMYAGTVSEKLYNYWDRIGDLLATYFPDLIKPDQVYFPKAIDIIPGDFHDNENYKWLKDFKDKKYMDLNNKRKQHVHYTTEDTQFKHEHLEKSTNREDVETLVKDRDDLADFYKDQLDLTLIGFEKTLLLIETITEKTLEDVK